jgi:L-rhamnose mutarotase
VTEVHLVKFRFKEGQKEKWLRWCEEEKRRSSEVLQTLENEGMISESCFLSEDENAIYYFMESEDFKKVLDAYRSSTFPIDDEHKAMTEETLDNEGARDLKVLFNFHLDAK